MKQQRINIKYMRIGIALVTSWQYLRIKHLKALSWMKINKIKEATVILLIF